MEASSGNQASSSSSSSVRPTIADPITLEENNSAPLKPASRPHPEYADDESAAGPGISSADAYLVQTADEGLLSHEEVLKRRKKRRRMDDLGFSSPGPAFLSVDSDGITTEAETEGRSRRRLTLSRADGPAPRAIVEPVSTSNGNGKSREGQIPSESNAQRLHEPISSQRNGSASHNGTSGAGSRSKSIFRNWTPKSKLENGLRRPSAGHKHQQERLRQASDTSSSELDDDAPRPRNESRKATKKIDHRPRQPFPTLTSRDARSITPNGATASLGAATEARIGSSPSKMAALHEGDASSSLEQKRDILIEARKREMDTIYREHDGLVREFFHLRKFITYIGFDPEVALQDRSDVFERFRMDYDLATLISGQKGRATRRVVSAKRGDLSLPRAEARANKLSASGVPRKAKRDALEEESSTPTVSGRRDARRKKGRQSELSSSRAIQVLSSSSDDEQSSLPPPKKRGRPPGKGRAQKLRESIAQPSSSSSSSSSEEEERPHSVSKSVLPHKGRRGRPPKITYEPKKPIDIERIDGMPPLRVLRPANFPLPSRFDRSLSRYLASWTTSGEFLGGINGEMETLSAEELKTREARLVQLYMRIDELRSKGLLQDRDEALRKSMQSRSREAIRPQTAWDTILTQIASHSAQKRADVRSKIALAKRTARMVQMFWDEKLGRGEKHRKAEERRIRALAKWTIREVRKQWKLAVNVIRAQRTAREKQEKDRLGREQLRSILEQSSQVLSEQHKALLEANEIDDSDVEEGDESSRSSSEEGSSEESDLEMSDANASSDESSLEVSLDDSSDELSHSEDEGGLAQLLATTSPVPDDEDFTEDESSAPESLLATPSDPAKADNEEEDEKFSINGRSARPMRTARHSRNATLFKKVVERAARAVSTDDDGSLDDDSDHFEVEDAKSAEEDAELDRQMREEDESDSDDGGENSDAELTVEELRRKYDYDNTEAKGTVDVHSIGDRSSEDLESDNESAELSTLTTAESNDDVILSPKIVELGEESQGDIYGAEKLDDLSGVAIERRSGSRTAASTPIGDQSSIKVKPPFLLRGNLRPYQQIGFEWLVNLYNTGSNGILADEMGLGKTIQTIALLGHLACDKGIWGPHLVVAPTSVMLNWEVEFKKFLPGFKILSYYGSQKERKEKRKGWNTENSFNVCITSYQLILADQHILRRKRWQYLVLDEAHHIKNFRSQRWQTLLGFNSHRRLLLTGTPLQNNLMDLWSLMYFLMPNGVTNAEGVVSSGFASMKEFQQWFSNPLDKAVESAGIGTVSEEMDNETKGMVSKLHILLRPYLLRRLKSEVEKEMPAKYEHVIKCRLSKRQQYLYNDFMSRAKTRESLASGNYLSIINCLMQLRKVCNHPDLFEQRPIVTSFAMDRSAVADFEVKELLVRREMLKSEERMYDGSHAPHRVNFDALNLRPFSSPQSAHLTPLASRSLSKLDASEKLPYAKERPPEPSLVDTWSLDGYAQSIAQNQKVQKALQWQHFGYLNRMRCQTQVSDSLLDDQSVALVRKLGSDRRLWPLSAIKEGRRTYWHRSDRVHGMILSNEERREEVQSFIDRFAFVTPRAISMDMPRWALPGLTYESAPEELLKTDFDTLHAPAVKLQIAFPDASLLQYDCGKLQELDKLMQNCKYGPHRILIFTQMTKILDILEIWLNFNGFNYLRLDGSTKVEDRQSLTEKFNRDDRIKAFILSTRSGGLGINLTGADMVLFWDLDWNFQIEAQCMDRAHRIGQTRDVHIYRFVSEHTIEENMLKKSQEKRLLDAMVIQDGQFTTEGLGKMSWIESMFDEGGRTIAGVRVGGGGNEDGQNQDERAGERKAPLASDRRIEMAMDAAEDEEDAQAARTARAEIHVMDDEFATEMGTMQPDAGTQSYATAAAQRRQDAHEAADANQTMTVEDTLDGGKYGDDKAITAGEGEEEEEEEEEEGGTVDDYMLRFVDADWDFFGAL